MFSNHEIQDDWNACPAGELARMVQHLDAAQRRARRKQLYGTAVLSMVLVAGGVLVLGTLLQPAESRLGGLLCSECRNHIVAYHDLLKGGADNMDVTLAKNMKAHLAQCGSCRGLFNTKYPGVLTDEVAAGMRPLLPTFAIAMDLAIY